MLPRGDDAIEDDLAGREGRLVDLREVVSLGVDVLAVPHLVVDDDLHVDDRADRHALLERDLHRGRSRLRADLRRPGQGLGRTDVRQGEHQADEDDD